MIGDLAVPDRGNAETEGFMDRASPSNVSSVLFILGFFAAFALVMIRFA
jgi:hypothetical protein